MKIVAQFEKNAREMIKVSLGSFKGRPICDVRCHFKTESGGWSPGVKGITFSTKLLPEIIESLKVAEQQLKGG